MRYGNRSLLVSMIVLVPLCGIAALAQSPKYKLGRTASEQEIRVWDTPTPIISADGTGLPPGRGTAQEGAKVFAQKCAGCHGPTATEGKFYRSQLAGGKGKPSDIDFERTVGNFWPYATTIWDFINRAMPASPATNVDATHSEAAFIKKKGSLSVDEVYAVTAFVLFRNGIIKEGDVIDAKSLPKVQMPNRNGFLPPDPTEWNPEARIEPLVSPKK